EIFQISGATHRDGLPIPRSLFLEPGVPAARQRPTASPGCNDAAQVGFEREIAFAPASAELIRLRALDQQALVQPGQRQPPAQQWSGAEKPDAAKVLGRLDWRER